MEKESTLEYAFKRKNQPIRIETNLTVTIDGEAVQVDPQLLFQRLVTAAGDLYDDPVEIFKYELCSYPLALFESSILLRAANKPTLADAIWALGECSANDNLLNGTEIYVLDGGSLLQPLPWPKRASFDAICDIYIDHVKTKYPKSIVVFYGYHCGPSTKDDTHLRRSKRKIRAEVHFKGSMVLQLKKRRVSSKCHQQTELYSHT